MHRGFNHKQFADHIKECKSPWMITYNDNETLRSWFSEYQCIPWDLQYTMKSTSRNEEEKKTGVKSGKKGKELLIKNY
jgi:site-specific DNA-adenine methylase